MAFDKDGLDSYIDVAQRIADFRERYPNGSLQPADPAKPWEQAIVTGTQKNGEPFTATMIVYTAAAYRTPDDQRPGIGVAWEAFPGRTPYTAGSELQNAETSAWGRAIVAALASDSKRGVSSREEIRNRQAERDEPQPQQRVRTAHTDPEHVRLAQRSPDERVNGSHAERGPVNVTEFPETDTPEDAPGSALENQVRDVQMAYQKAGFKRTERDLMLKASGQIIDRQLTGPNEGLTHKNLSYNEAVKLKTKLAKATRADLVAEFAEAAS